MELHLKIIGYISIGLALAHVVFPRYFQWEKDLQGVSLINRQLMFVHTFFIAFVVFLMGIFCLWSSKDLIETRLGNQIVFGLFLFWGVRLYFQFFVYSPKLWRGKIFETIVHIVFSLIWTYFVVVFFIIYINKQEHL